MSSAFDDFDKLTPQVTSKSVEAALNMFSQADESLRMAQNELEYCDKKTQDILHEIELCEQTYHERARSAVELRKIRQRRRAAKDIIDTVTPLINWMSCQTDAINLLKKYLGEMRKAESKMKGRVYWKRACDAGENFIIADEKKNEKK